MAGLPCPDLAPGPHRALVEALHALHHRAGWPSLRRLAAEAGCSHTTVSHVFSSTRLPSWGTLELVVEALGGDTAHFHELWLAATSPGDRGVPAAPGPRLAGRRAELGVVRRHLEAGRGLLLLSGESGIGKTRLVATAAELVGESCFVATGACLPLSVDVPLLPVAEALRAAHEADDGAWFAQALARCPAFVPGSLARILPEVAHLAVQPDPDDEWSRHRLHTAVAMTLTALAQLRPLAVVLEDLHWADGATLDLVENLLSRPQHLPALGTWRLDDPDVPARTREWSTRVQRSPAVTVLRLGPLSREETAEQLRLLLGDRLDERALAQVYARSRGHPLFAEQLASAVAGHDGARLPHLVADLMDQRIDQLPPEALMVAAALGVAERPLTDEDLARVTGVDREVLLEGSHELMRRRLLADPPPGPRAVDLRHPLMGEAVRRRLDPAERADLHRALAEVLAEGSEPSPTEVAVHWERAGEPVHELRWRILAAHEAEDRFATDQAAEQWQRALALWAELERVPELPETRCAAYLHAMDALVDAGQMPRALELAREAVGCLPDLTPQESADLHRRLGFYVSELEDARAGLAVLDQALALYADLPPSKGHVDALELKSMVLYGLGRHDDAWPVIEQSLAVAERAADPGDLVEIVPSVAWARAIGSDLAGALELIGRLPTVLDPLPPRAELWLGVTHTDLLLIHAAPADEVVAAATRATDVARAWRLDTYYSCLVRANAAEALLREGRVDEAAAWLPALDDDPTHTTWALHWWRTVLDLLRGRGAEARARLARLDELPMAWRSHRLARAQAGAMLAFWDRSPQEALARLEPELAGVLPTDEARFAGGALVLAARAAASLARTTDPSGAALARVRWMRGGARHDPFDPAGVAGDRHAQRASWEAEVARAGRTDTVDGWAVAAREWEALRRPFDAAYCRWRGAQAAIRSGQRTAADRLLRRAALEARGHEPLSAAIRGTAEGARTDPGGSSRPSRPDPPRTAGSAAAVVAEVHPGRLGAGRVGRAGPHGLGRSGVATGRDGGLVLGAASGLGGRRGLGAAGTGGHHRGGGHAGGHDGGPAAGRATRGVGGVHGGVLRRVEWVVSHHGHAVGHPVDGR